MEAPIFFGKRGLTSTSANHVANMAKELVEALSNDLDSTRFVTKKAELITGNRVLTLTEGQTDLNFSGKLEEIHKAHALIAWLREAIKARTEMVTKINTTFIRDWAKAEGIELPESPEEPDELDKDDVIAEWPADKRSRYHDLEAAASTYGKFIHPSGSLNRARKEMSDKARNPRSVEGEGDQLVVYSYEPSVSADAVDKVFFELQAKQREYQADLNSMLHEAETEAQQRNLESNGKYKKLLEAYNDKMKLLRADFNDWQENQLREVQALKIVIPSRLKDIFDKVSSLGKA